MTFALPYAYTALEPALDAKTMEIHHLGHHQAYVTNLNSAIAGTEWAEKLLEEILRAADRVSPAIRDNSGGHWNHSFFWTSLQTNLGGEGEWPIDAIYRAIVATYGSYEQFKGEFTAVATARLGSGWVWLCKQDDGSLQICATPYQDNPLMPGTGCTGTPVLSLDVWEHAYYLHYQNRRPHYVAAFLELINWQEVNRRYKAA
jgi:Fe-Mn family superoxide dismutase